MSESPFAAAPPPAPATVSRWVPSGEGIVSGPDPASVAMIAGRSETRPCASVLVFRFAATVSWILLTPKTAGARRASRDSRPGRRRVRWTRRPDHPFAVD